MNRRNFLKLTGGLGLVAPLSSAMAAQPDLSEASLERLLAQLDARSTLYPRRLHVSSDRMAKRAREILTEAEARASWRRQRFERRLDEFVAWVEREWTMTDGPARAWYAEGDRHIRYDTVALGALLTSEQLEDGRADGITARSAILRAVREDWERGLAAYRAAGIERPRLVWRSRPRWSGEHLPGNYERHALRMRLATPDLLPGMSRSHCCAFCYVKPEGVPAIHIDARGLRGT